MNRKKVNEITGELRALANYLVDHKLMSGVGSALGAELRTLTEQTANPKDYKIGDPAGDAQERAIDRRNALKETMLDVLVNAANRAVRDDHYPEERVAFQKVNQWLLNVRPGHCLRPNEVCQMIDIFA